MKKLTAFLLALVLLIPMALGVSAETNTIASFEETFDSYPDGKITNKKMEPADAWGYSMSKNGSSIIRDKALALTGTVTYQNLLIPARITAAGAYAKEQTWQITVTIPEGLNSDAEIQLLRYESKGNPVNNRGKALTDNGIRIKGGVLYYNQLLDKHDTVKIRMEDKNLCKLNPGTYTIKRTLKIHDPKNFTHSILVVDAAGKEVAKLQDVDCPEYTSITSISFGTNKANAEVVFDDYKIYASGVITNLTLTDAATEKPVEADKPHSADTAYSLAWFNGTDKAKTYILMADFYRDDKMIEKKVLGEFTLAPGQEGAETGAVEVEEGQSVKIYLRDPARERAQQIQKILLIAAGVVALALAVVLLILLVKLIKKQIARWKAYRAAQLEAFLNCDDIIIDEEEDEEDEDE